MPAADALAYDYASCVRRSEKVAWALDDVLPHDTQLDLTRRLMPESMVPLAEAEGLDATACLYLNQIVGNAYLNLLAFVEEYIVVMATRHAYGELFGDSQALRALLRLADEELKHQALFARFRERLAPHLPEVAVVDNAVALAGFVLDKTPIAVGLITLHLELATQQHFVLSVRDDDGIEPSFARALKFHWIEEAQHAKIDALQIAGMVAVSDSATIDSAIDDYFEICDALCALTTRQAALDVESLSRHLGGPVPGADALRTRLAGAYDRMFIDAGGQHPMFLKTVGKIYPDAVPRLQAAVRQ